jgi:hypothetical protein
MLSDMFDPFGKGWNMQSPAAVRSQQGNSKVTTLAGNLTSGFSIACQVSNESLILAQNQRWRRA